MFRHVLLFLIIIHSAVIGARAVPTDSIVPFPADEEVLWHPEPRQLILPASLIAAGAAGASLKWWRLHVDDEVSRSLNAGRSLRVANYVEWLPYAGFLGAGFLGAQSRADIVDRALLTATSFIILEAVTQPLKRVAHRERPDMSDFHSFPSGHTATAFAGAELTRMVYGNTLGLCSYAVATGVACLRVAGRHHYLTDCIAGAGIGILSARLAAWLIPAERRLLRLDGRAAAPGVALIPVVGDRSAALSFSLSF